MAWPRTRSAFNEGVRYIAEREAITLVDVYEAFHGDNTTLIDVDGLHPARRLPGDRRRLLRSD